MSSMAGSGNARRRQARQVGNNKANSDSPPHTDIPVQPGLDHDAPSYQDNTDTHAPEPSHSLNNSPSPSPTDTRTSHAPSAASKAKQASGRQASASFRNVSACNRCRLRKNKCDQKLPACSACERAGVKCVSYDPITKQQVPRHYVHYLEERCAYLEAQLRNNGVTFVSARSFALGDQAGDDATSPTIGGQLGEFDTQNVSSSQEIRANPTIRSSNEDPGREVDDLVSSIGLVSVQGASDARFLGSTSGISFARVVFHSVKSANSQSLSNRSSRRSSKAALKENEKAPASMRDSIFGLHKKPFFKEAPFPDRELGYKLVDLYMEYANPQIPILHRVEFMKLFSRVYSPNHQRTARESYLLNIVFAIGAGVILNSNDKDDESESETSKSSSRSSENPAKRRRFSSKQHRPEEYHASAIVHLESFLNSSPAGPHPDGFGGGLEELQAVLLLASFALLRPIAPGLWYLVGVAVRLAIDLGLHHDDGSNSEGDNEDSFEMTDSSSTLDPNRLQAGDDQNNQGHKQWIRDLRRRLWWCVYGFDRLVSTCVGRPFGITDSVVTTKFPSLLGDEYITPSGLKTPPPNSPSYKHVAHHYIRLRLLQSEILQVLQHQQAQKAKQNAKGRPNPYLHRDLPSPFLSRFDSLREWRDDVDARLLEWKTTMPTPRDIGVEYNTGFLELNYWQAIITLYRPTITMPSTLAGEAASVYKNLGGSGYNISDEADAEDRDFIFLKIAEAGEKILRLYRQLHRVHLVNYTYLATHHLFMAGIAFLFAIWHSNLIRSRLSLDSVDFTVLAGTSVLEDLSKVCPPARACRDAFSRMSKVTIQICMSTTGFGQSVASAEGSHPSAHHPGGQRAFGRAGTSPAATGEAKDLSFKGRQNRAKPSQSNGRAGLQQSKSYDIQAFSDSQNLFGGIGGSDSNAGQPFERSGAQFGASQSNVSQQPHYGSMVGSSEFGGVGTSVMGGNEGASALEEYYNRMPELDPPQAASDSFDAKPTWAPSPPASEASGIPPSLAATSSNDTPATSTHPTIHTSMDNLGDPTPFQFDPDLGIDFSNMNPDLPMLADNDEMQMFGGGFDMLDGYWFGAGGAGPDAAPADAAASGGFDMGGMDLDEGDLE
ncbi:MAG: Fungal specific transcription factor [Alyxoria varia]|nr:MAG: Fungal specific transcription factor [Alyxoria varia]